MALKPVHLQTPTIISMTVVVHQLIEGHLVI